MKRLNSATVFFISMLFFIGVLTVASLHFFSKVNDQYIMVQSGTKPTRFIIDNYKYVQNKKGLVYSLAFLLAGTSFFIMILLPSEEVKKKKVDEPVKTPAPPIRKDSPISAVIEQPETKEASEETEDEQVALPKPKAIDVLAEIEEDVELDEFTEDTYHEIVEGEDDVVYGTEEITNAAIMDFVHKYPDSALKFLYRKRLDGKAVSSEEEEIYRNWEKRKMFRAKVKAYILSLMEWDKMPQEPLFEIWKRMRDHIYEVID